MTSTYYTICDGCGQKLAEDGEMPDESKAMSVTIEISVDVSTRKYITLDYHLECLPERFPQVEEFIQAEARKKRGNK